MSSPQDRLKAKGAQDPALPKLPLRLHPSKSVFVWAAGRFIFVYDTDSSEQKPHRWEAHTDTIRSLDMKVSLPYALDSAGDIWISAGDDKQVIIWEDTGSCWKTLFKLSHTKKVTAALFDAEGLVVFADRFGDVYRWSPTEGREGTLLFSHLAIVTAMVFAGDGNFLITGDNHEKIRVTFYPDAAEIYSFCLGHTAQVTSLAPHGSKHLLSTAADGTLRLWSLDGESLACAEMGAPISCMVNNGSSLVASCEAATGALKFVQLSDELSFTVTDLSVPEAPQAVCMKGSGSSADMCNICYVDKRGHLCIRTAEGEWKDIFVGDDVTPNVVNLSKSANLWSEIGRQEGAEADEDQGDSKKKGKKRALSSSAGVCGKD